MKNVLRSPVWTIIFVFIITAFAIPAVAQKDGRVPWPPLWEDTSMNPHDFTNRFYSGMGINAKEILGRRTGSDSYSTFSGSSNPDHTSVRVIVTVPAYDQDGKIIFWYPLGQCPDDAFMMDTKVGVLAHQTAELFPMYVFPQAEFSGAQIFTNTRQAPLIDNSWLIYGLDKDLNPLGLREIMVVNYTKKAFSEEAAPDMEYFAKKNGLSTEDTPLIKSLTDLQYLLKTELVTAEPLLGKLPVGDYAMAPMIADPTRGVIAKDAYIWMATKDGKSLTGEEMFKWHFGCLQKTGEWCQEF